MERLSKEQKQRKEKETTPPSVLTLPILGREAHSLISLTLFYLSLFLLFGESLHYPPPIDSPCPGLVTNVWKNKTQSSRDFGVIREPIPSESNDSPTGDSSGEEVPANNLLEFSSDSEDKMKKLNKTQGAAVFIQKIYSISYFRM
ncbi:hypothetical protein TNCV_1818311 [Trichonephila clavipes]|nr:hypothetical protein TNCV_1818311 [Trichonephila clavipes]